MKAKTYALDDIIVVVMRGSGFTPLEQTIMDSGEPDRVIAMREDFQRVMAERYKETIEELTGRKVLAFLSQAHVEPDITMEIFFVDGPLEGFGARRDHRARTADDGLIRSNGERLGHHVGPGEAAHRTLSSLRRRLTEDRSTYACRAKRVRLGRQWAASSTQDPSGSLSQ